ncbi:MAG: heavy metal translocating P-type ATPase [Rhizomicrobium sp.]
MTGAMTLALRPTDLADDLSRYIHRRDDGVFQFEVAVKGARCANCIAKIEAGVTGVAGVSEARLNLSTGKLTVNWKLAAASPHAVLRRIRDLGYEAQPFDAAASLNADEGEGRMLLRCLAVSAFGTVFTMGLTDAIWYGGELSPALRQTFFLLAASVATPVTLYAGQPFFRSAFRALARGRTNMDVPISAALILSLGLSIYQSVQGGQNVYFDAAVMLAFLLLIGRYLDFRLRNRARDAARHLLALQSLLARRFKPDGKIETVAARELNPGDRILLASGERVPVNGTLESADGGGTELDTSLVTGESAPVRMILGAALQAGSIVTGQPAVLRATARVEDSLVADLARLLEAGQQTRGLYVRLADRAARAYVPFVSGLALMVFAGWLASGATLAIAATNAIAVLIITCPCALGLAVPAVQIVATGRLFQRGLFVKSGDALERLAEIDLAVFDKTGTLTTGQPVLKNREKIAPDILELAATLARASHHPLAAAIAAAAGPGPVAPGVRETAGAGMEAVIDGRPCRLGSAAWCGVTDDLLDGRLWLRCGDAEPVRFAFQERIRPEARALLAELMGRGIAVEMLTGDREEPAAVIAAAAGIANWGAGIGPREKAARMETLRQQGRHVLMVGDGLNDAAAMALAHVSIAPGTAADVSQSASDMVLRGDSLEPIVEAIDVARKARHLVLQNFALAAVYNLTAIPLAAFGFVTPLIAAATMAGSSLLVMLNALRLARRPA